MRQQPSQAATPARQSAYEYDSYYAQACSNGCRGARLMLHPQRAGCRQLRKDRLRREERLRRRSGCGDAAAADDAAARNVPLVRVLLHQKWGLNIGGWTTQSFTWNSRQSGERS